MGLLKPLTVALVVVVAGCYEPDLEACAVTCESDVGCPDSMVCGDVGLCVFSAADSCAPGPGSNDAGQRVFSVAIAIEGNGHVVDHSDLDIDCDQQQCVYDVADGAALELEAKPRKDQAFDGWLGACAGEDQRCTLIIDGDVSATATFVPKND